MAARTFFTTSRVEASARLVTGRYTVRLPFANAYEVVTSAESATVATSRMNTAPASVRLSGTASRSLTFETIALVGTIGYLPSRFMLPEGLIGLPLAIACTMSSGDNP